MKQLAPKVLAARYIRPQGQVELPDCTDQHRRLQHGFDITVADPYAPAFRGLVPVRRQHLGVELHMWVEVGLTGDAQEVVLDFTARRKILAPGVARTKGIGVCVIGRIHPAARVAVFQPGAAGIGVLVHNSEGNPPLQQQLAQHQTAHTRAHNQHVQPLR